jgi:putative Mn2+ efflux pump MntP
MGSGTGYVAEVLALLLVALSVGLDNFAASTAIGVLGVNRRLRVRVALIFGLFEALMPVVGILLGHSLAHDLGDKGNAIGGTLLGLAGVYAIANDLIGDRRKMALTEPSVTRLILVGAALSVDNLIIGFALGTLHTSLVVAALVIGIVSVTLSLLGLEIGNRLSGRLGKRSEVVGGALLVFVGVALGTGLL